MRYRMTREVGVFIPRDSPIWLPTDYGLWRRAPEAVLQNLLNIMKESIGGTKTSNGLVIDDNNEFFASGSRLWYRTAWTTSPVPAALYDLELENALKTLWLYLDEPDDKLELIIHRTSEGPDIAAPEESYAVSGDETAVALLRGLADDGGFRDRVLLPYLAVRRAFISCLAFRLGTSRADDLARSVGTSYLQRIMCRGCTFPCSALIRTHPFIDQDEEGYELTINLGDSYRFGRLTAATLANTSVLIQAAAKGFLDGVDLAFSNPLDAIRGIGVAPFAYRTALRDGRTLRAMDIAAIVMERLNEFIGTAGAGGEDIEPVVHAILTSHMWFPQPNKD